MSFALVQSAVLQNQLGVSLSVAFTANPTVGNSIAVATFVRTTATIVSITNPATDLFNKIVSSNTAADCELWLANSIAGGVNSKTMTVTWTGSGNPGIGAAIMEISGGSMTARNTSTGHGTGTNPSAGTVTTASGDFCIAAVSNSGGVNGYTAGSGWTDIMTSAQVGGMEYQTASGSSVTGNFLNSNSATWDAVVAAFKIGGGPPPGSGSNIQVIFLGW